MIQVNKGQTIIVNEELITEIKELLEKRWNHNNFEFPTLSNYIQKAIEEYRIGNLKLKEGLGFKGERKTISVRLNQEQIEFYHSLTKGRKGLIIDKILEAYKEKL